MNTLPTNPMVATTAPIIQPSTYEADVFAWGSDKPWSGLPALSNKGSFDWVEVLTDGGGNVIEMPLLRSKPCFGRPETNFRHGGGRRVAMIKGSRREVSNQCGRCPVSDSCRNLSTERVRSDPGMEGAFRAWADTCKVHNGGKSAFTGPFYGRHWEAFKKSIADHGPFENSNDERLRKMAELERSERHTVWAEKSRRWRVIARERQQLLHKPPSANFIKAAVNERERRSQSLEIAAGRTDLPRRISKIPAAQAGKTAELTADVWLQGELLLAMGQGGKPGRIASALVSQGRNHGLAYASLKARIKSDLARGLELEKLGIWQPFDPDCDLADQQSMPGGDHDYSHAVHSNDESLTAEQMVDLLSLLWPRLDLPTT